MTQAIMVNDNRAHILKLSLMDTSHTQLTSMSKIISASTRDGLVQVDVKAVDKIKWELRTLLSKGS